MGACESGYADCDMQASTGCEISTQTDPLHCGGCNAACPALGGTCVSGGCRPRIAWAMRIGARMSDIAVTAAIDDAAQLR